MPSTWATLKEAFFTLFYPWIFMSLSARHIPLTVRTLLAEGSFLSLLSPWAFCDALFGHFWATAGPLVKNSAEIRVIPLLEGRVTNGQVSDSVVGTPVGGTVVEIGAGSGNWVDVFLKINTDSSGDTQSTTTTTTGGGGELRNRGGRSNGITKIYGVEPHPQSAAALRKRVAEVGLDDIYEVIPLGIESLSDPASPHPTTIAPGSVDCIVSVLCLCSIPDQEENIRALYKLLKPGGRWYVYEHVKAKRGGPLLKLYQRKLPPPLLTGLVRDIHGRWVADSGLPRLRQYPVVLLHWIVPPVLSDRRQSAQGRALVQDRCRPAAGRASIRPSPTHSGNIHQVETSSTSRVYDHGQHTGRSILE